MTHVLDSPQERRPRQARLAARLNSLTSRVMVASGLLAVLVAGVFALLALTVSDLSDAAGREARAKDVVADTVVLQKLVIDLETGVRGFALTGDQRFLQPWRRARMDLPARRTAFLRGAADSPTRLEAARQLVDRIQQYLDEYAVPIVEIAKTNPRAARSATSVQVGRRHTDAIRKLFDSFLATERRLAAQSAASAKHEARRAIMVGFGGVAASVLMILVLGVYLSRSIGRPVREVAAGANRIARGDLAVRLDDRGPGEVRSLRRAFSAMAADLAERQRALEVQNARLRESERLKSELVSIVSHEIRTPLASILGFTSVLLQRQVPPEDQNRFLQIIGAESKRLAGLLDEFLDVQRIEEGPLQLSLGEVDLSSIIRTQVALYSAESDRHQLELRLPEQPLLVEGDAGRLAQVVSNLLSNAIKYSPEGGIVEVNAEQENGTVRLSVRDEGFGIPPEVQDRIFTKFFRGTAAASGISGTGLGLALARAVVEAHGGSIVFESALGAGTTFSVELPRHTSVEAAGDTGERR